MMSESEDNCVLCLLHVAVISAYQTWHVLPIWKFLARSSSSYKYIKYLGNILIFKIQSSRYVESHVIIGNITLQGWNDCNEILLGLHYLITVCYSGGLGWTHKMGNSRLR